MFGDLLTVMSRLLWSFKEVDKVKFVQGDVEAMSLSWN
jgi:hypothetical protein